MRRALGLLVLFLLAAAPAPARAADWASPQKFETFSLDRRVKAVFEPALSDAGGGKLKVSEMTADGEHVLYETRLAAFPAKAFVSGRGAVVTVDEHGRKGYAHSVVVYSSEGKLLKDYALERLLTPEEIEQNVPVSVSSRHWIGNVPGFAFSDDDSHFQIRTQWGKSLVFNLATGEIG